jgi:transglutaminase-like putative cysteine protease
VKIHVGFDLTYESAHSTPMIFMLNVHPSRAHDLITPDRLRITPSRAISPYIDRFGNKCVRILAPPGQLRVACDTIVADSGKPDRVDLSAEQHAVADLPHDALVYLLASRYCETDLMMDKAWELFGRTPPGWRRVQSICDFVHSHITFGYQDADATRGAARGFTEQRGVCRDFAHGGVLKERCCDIRSKFYYDKIDDVRVFSGVVRLRGVGHRLQASDFASDFGVGDDKLMPLKIM